MQLISEEYRSLNEKLHKENKNFGANGDKFLKEITMLCKSLKTTDILDYGCGKSMLAHNLPFKIQQYDPAIPKFAESPEPAEIVVCTDVLEHIEPDRIESVLNHIRELTKRVVFLVVTCGPAMKTLPDGRNAHLTQRESGWWVKELTERFRMVRFESMDAKQMPDYKFLFIGKPR